MQPAFASGRARSGRPRLGARLASRWWKDVVRQGQPCDACARARHPAVLHPQSGTRQQDKGAPMSVDAPSLPACATPVVGGQREVGKDKRGRGVFGNILLPPTLRFCTVGHSVVDGQAGVEDRRGAEHQWAWFPNVGGCVSPAYVRVRRKGRVSTVSLYGGERARAFSQAPFLHSLVPAAGARGLKAEGRPQHPPWADRLMGAARWRAPTRMASRDGRAVT